jgi:hypothetical protein
MGRPYCDLLSFTVTGLAEPGPVTIVGARVGDYVKTVVNLTTPGSSAANFEEEVTVDDQVQQTGASDLSTETLLVQLARE